MRDPFLVFLFWGPTSAFTGNPKGFRAWAVGILALMGIGLWFALFPRGELMGPDAYVLLALAVFFYIVVGFFHLRKTS